MLAAMSLTSQTQEWKALVEHAAQIKQTWVALQHLALISRAAVGNELQQII